MTPTDEVSITLQVQEWNSILDMLMGAPWRIANPLLDKISAQAKAAEMAVGPQTNGADNHAPN